VLVHRNVGPNIKKSLPNRVSLTSRGGTLFCLMFGLDTDFADYLL
jgi:hypothetical protein